MAPLRKLRPPLLLFQDDQDDADDVFKFLFLVSNSGMKRRSLGQACGRCSH